MQYDADLYTKLGREGADPFMLGKVAAVGFSGGERAGLGGTAGSKSSLKHATRSCSEVPVSSSDASAHAQQQMLQGSSPYPASYPAPYPALPPNWTRYTNAPPSHPSPSTYRGQPPDSHSAYPQSYFQSGYQQGGGGGQRSQQQVGSMSSGYQQVNNNSHRAAYQPAVLSGYQPVSGASLPGYQQVSGVGEPTTRYTIQEQSQERQTDDPLHFADQVLRRYPNSKLPRGGYVGGPSSMHQTGHGGFPATALGPYAGGAPEGTVQYLNPGQIQPMAYYNGAVDYQNHRQAPQAAQAPRLGPSYNGGFPDGMAMAASQPQGPPAPILRRQGGPYTSGPDAGASPQPSVGGFGVPARPGPARSLSPGKSVTFAEPQRAGGQPTARVGRDARAPPPVARYVDGTRGCATFRVG
ncbi:hypothetical protein DIPPA_08130 [Diplonema papillatum]|nr:hypothetical protein DIPPA_08130 [Diplonema papillatum]